MKLLEQLRLSERKVHVATTVRRFEFKYLVPADVFEALQADLEALLPHDHYSEKCPGKFYHVRTLYLDTPGLRHFYEKEDGLEEKTKYRLRCYSPVAHAGMRVFLEIKRRRNLFIVKNRESLAWEDAGRIWESGWLDARHAEFAWALQRRGLRPKALIVYERQAWTSPDKLTYLRVTADKCLRARRSEALFGGRTKEAQLFPGHVVLEIKFERTVPFQLYAMLRKYGLHRQALSKYHGAGELLGMDRARLGSFLEEGQWTD